MQPAARPIRKPHSATLSDAVSVYSEADITGRALDSPREETVDRVIRTVNGYLGNNTMADSETVMVDLGSPTS